ncbi:hypothetical protein Ddc_11966 [Ditylenchus destructor]|nr:hypothetical protein Ddc_11966 [Ditylenchus destructor]
MHQQLILTNAQGRLSAILSVPDDKEDHQSSSRFCFSWILPLINGCECMGNSMEQTSCTFDKIQIRPQLSPRRLQQSVNVVATDEIVTLSPNLVPKAPKSLPLIAPERQHFDQVLPASSKEEKCDWSEWYELMFAVPRQLATHTRSPATADCPTIPRTILDAPSREICVHILIDDIPLVLKLRVASKEYDDFRILDLYIDGNQICRKTLKNYATINDYGLQNLSTIFLVHRVHGGEVPFPKNKNLLKQLQKLPNAPYTDWLYIIFGGKKGHHPQQCVWRQIGRWNDDLFLIYTQICHAMGLNELLPKDGFLMEWRTPTTMEQTHGRPPKAATLLNPLNMNMFRGIIVQDDIATNNVQGHGIRTLTRRLLHEIGHVMVRIMVAGGHFDDTDPNDGHGGLHSKICFELGRISGIPDYMIKMYDVQ